MKLFVWRLIWYIWILWQNTNGIQSNWINTTVCSFSIDMASMNHHCTNFYLFLSFEMDVLSYNTIWQLVFFKKKRKRKRIDTFSAYCVRSLEMLDQSMNRFIYIYWTEYVRTLYVHIFEIFEVPAYKHVLPFLIYW